MRLHSLTLAAYGRCTDVTVAIGDGVTVVLGANEAGKSTALDALSDLLWGIPQHPRNSAYPRDQLRIDATLDIDGEVRTLVRRSTGLFADDLVTVVNPPWNPEGLGAQWWRTRLGINHDELRRGGAEVFVGGGDIGELVFAARQGRSAREVLAWIDAAANELFRVHKGNKSVKLRLAETAFDRAVEDRDARLTRAGDVVDQRGIVATLERDLERAMATVTGTAQALKRAEEDGRVVASVLTLRQARADLATIDGEGDLLSPAELVEYSEARAARARADELVAELAGDIASLTRLISELAVDDALLDDKGTLDRLQPHAAARIGDLQRAEEEFGPAVESATAGLRTLLQGIGIEEGDDLDAALAGARVRADHAAALNDLAERIEILEQKREAAKEKRNEALDALLAKGIRVDFATSMPPNDDAIDALRDALVTARARVVTLGTMLVDAQEATTNLRDGTPAPRDEATITSADVAGLRTARDVQWSHVRRAWVAGDLPDAGERSDLAADLDGRISAADRAADDEASGRARIAMQDARIEAHVEGLEAARLKEEAAAAALADASVEVVRLAADWAAAWAALGIETAPGAETAPAIVGLLVTAHAAHAKDLSAFGRIAELEGPWAQAAALVGLTTATTTAAWRAQAAVLEQVASVQAMRTKAQAREAKARTAWESFLAEADELLQRHGAHESERPITPAQVEQGLSQLVRRLSQATAASATRTGYREQIDAKSVALESSRQTTQRAAAVLQRLADGHAVASGPDLDVLADLAERSSDPLAREADALRAIRLGLDAGTSPTDAIARLHGQGEVTVRQALDTAKALDDDARRAADGIRERRTTARDQLAELEEAAGAADAEAELMTRQAEVARLTEAWAVLALQRRLLEDVLASLGTDDARPLLDRAGQILERLTGGRWVALRAEEDANSRRLLVVRSDNDRVGTAKLSEGTADQVFLSLRLAAVAELHAERIAAGEQALPLVLDDVLMAFDDDRSADALGILQDLAPGLQVIVFTHHQRVADAAAAIDGVVVSTLPSPAPIADALDGEQVRAHAQEGAVAATSAQERAPRAPGEADPATVRRWAQEQGIEVNARGRVSQAIIDQYLQAQR
jgi:hypothetical protein